jgi:hypothetical protein
MALFTANGGCIPAGRVFSVNPTSGLAELGVAGRRVGFINRRSTGNPSTGFFNDVVSAQASPHMTFKNGMEHKVMMYALMQGMEFSTTEYASGSYNIHDLLRAPDAAYLSNDNAAIVASGGKVTKASVTYGKDAVVGVVTKVPALNQHNVNAICFYSLYAPPIEGVTDAVKNVINA